MAEKSAVNEKDIRFCFQGVYQVMNYSDLITKAMNFCTLLAISENHALLFVATTVSNKIKAFLLNDFVKMSPLPHKILCHAVDLPGLPKVMSCSCDGEMLAVNYSKCYLGYLIIYDVSSFSKKNTVALYNIQLNSCESLLTRHILWNTTNPNKVGIVTLDGKSYVYNLKEHEQYERYPASNTGEFIEQARCGCWSPEGNKIVFGFTNGKLRIFDSNLMLEKTIVCTLNMKAAVQSDTIAVHWLSNENRFLVAFVKVGDEQSPSIHVIDAWHSSTIHQKDIIINGDTQINQLHQIADIKFHMISDHLLIVSTNTSKIFLLETHSNRRNELIWYSYDLQNKISTDFKSTCPQSLACYNVASIKPTKINSNSSLFLLCNKGHLLVYNLLQLASIASTSNITTTDIQTDSKFSSPDVYSVNKRELAAAKKISIQSEMEFEENTKTRTFATQTDKPISFIKKVLKGMKSSEKFWSASNNMVTSSVKATQTDFKTDLIGLSSEVKSENEEIGPTILCNPIDGNGGENPLKKLSPYIPINSNAADDTKLCDKVSQSSTIFQSVAKISTADQQSKALYSKLTQLKNMLDKRSLTSISEPDSEINVKCLSIKTSQFSKYSNIDKAKPKEEGHSKITFLQTMKKKSVQLCDNETVKPNTKPNENISPRIKTSSSSDFVPRTSLTEETIANSQTSSALTSLSEIAIVTRLSGATRAEPEDNRDRVLGELVRASELRVEANANDDPNENFNRLKIEEEKGGAAWKTKFLHKIRWLRGRKKHSQQANADSQSTLRQSESVMGLNTQKLKKIWRVALTKH